MKNVIRFLPTGEVRGIYTDAVPLRRILPGLMPHRASRIEVVQEGRHRGRFSVDFSLLAELTGNPEHRSSLATTFDSYQEAIRAEVQWLQANYILGG